MVNGVEAVRWFSFSLACSRDMPPDRTPAADDTLLATRVSVVVQQPMALYSVPWVVLLPFGEMIRIHSDEF